MRNPRQVFSPFILSTLALTASACLGDPAGFEDQGLAAGELSEAGERVLDHEEIEYQLEVLRQLVDDGAIDLSRLGGEVDADSGEFSTAVSFIEVRLRHASTGKCIYGNPVEDGQIHNWVCWDDPGMVYRLYNWGNPNLVFLVHKATSKYIEGNAQNGAALTNRSGYNPYAPVVFELQDAGGGKKRLRSNYTGNCIYGTNTDGGTVHSWTCWNDPGMSYYLDPV